MATVNIIRRAAIAAAVLAVAFSAWGQENEKAVKTGWNFGPLPAVSYNSDLGFQYGALCDIYYYGDGSLYPNYLHKFNVEISRYTKGAGTYHFFYDSKHIIPGIRLTFAATYMPNKMNNFYGFNGLASPLNADAENAFYSFERNMARILADFQGTVSGNLGWAAGVSFWNYRTGRVGLNKYSGTKTLYDLYVAEGIVRPEEAGGGSHMEFKAGLVYDTRDHEAAPSRGVYAEAILYGSPDMIEQRGDSYLKMGMQFRHFVTLSENRLVLAYRIAWQGTLAGEAPYYMQPNIATLYLRQIRSEGLGGPNTIRGVLLSRLVGEGYAWSNFELRCRLFDFRFINQFWYVAVNPFFDAGMVVQPYRLDEMRASGDGRIYSGRDEKLHMSAGIGAQLSMNRNFIVSVEWGKPFEKQSGPGSLNIGLNYIF